MFASGFGAWKGFVDEASRRSCSGMAPGTADDEFAISIGDLLLKKLRICRSLGTLFGDGYYPIVVLYKQDFRDVHWVTGL